jgi:hypothetical protein
MLGVGSSADKRDPLFTKRVVERLPIATSGTIPIHG